MSMNTARQLVADRQAAFGATAHRSRLRRMLSRAEARPAISLDLVALERAAAPAPTARRVNKVA